ncbi:type IV pilin protein [Gloeobacter violaceus]|uniref:Gll2255 protein n=1 Tax=Gloeobacter violaceus (strain ATCC 29082 / PCC 7421) TaxID=251221 RepID=Q7NIC8_GLOVI|nr:prepilin-type N-terminal cleavage/methylation domain-containing protein [Gloeobacter violaceus]BAC90196.1 gll2255 [Gloeobacter violaceus PCC 7421]
MASQRAPRGFTLIELLVVVIIVGILAAVALPNFLGQTGKAKTTEATAAIDAGKTAQEAYLNETGAYYTAGTMGAGGVPAANADTLGGTLVQTGVDLNELQAAIQVGHDATRFVSAAPADGTKWAIAHQAGGQTAVANSNTDFAINVDGGAATAAGTQVRGLAASYLKSAAKIVIDANPTR